LGCYRKWIKWSVATEGDSVAHFIMDSINPIRVLGGIAAFSGLVCHSISNESEEEVLEYAKKITAEQIKELTNQSIFISYRDKAQMLTPPGYPIKLWEPTQEEIEFRDKLLLAFYKILAKAL